MLHTAEDSGMAKLTSTFFNLSSRKSQNREHRSELPESKEQHTLLLELN
jgi:hypothetical protein